MNENLNIKPNSLTSGPEPEIPIYGLRAEVQSVIRHLQEVYGCPESYITSTIFCMVGALCGHRVQIDTGKYKNKLTIWVAHIGPSGSNKSEPTYIILSHLFELDEKIRKEGKRNKKAAQKRGELELPPVNKLVNTDITMPAVYKDLAEKERGEFNEGLLLHFDELCTHLSALDSPQNVGDLSRMLSLFDGRKVNISRATQDDIDIYHPCVCILGSIQPGDLRNAFNSRKARVGLTQRFLFVYPLTFKEGDYIDTVPNPEYTGVLRELVEKVIRMKSMQLTLSPEAKQAYIDYYNKTQRKSADANDYERSLYAKLRIYVLKWVGLTHLLGCPDDAGDGGAFALPKSLVVTEDEMLYAIDCMAYFEETGKRVLQETVTDLVQVNQPTKKQVIKYLYALYPETNTGKLSQALNVSRQNIEKMLK